LARLLGWLLTPLLLGLTLLLGLLTELSALPAREGAFSEPVLRCEALTLLTVLRCVLLALLVLPLLLVFVICHGSMGGVRRRRRDGAVPSNPIASPDYATL